MHLGVTSVSEQNKNKGHYSKIERKEREAVKWNRVKYLNV